ncbi:MAG: PEP/pyruvate-binding domain-containing protein [Bdellovibrionota bacterium]
MKLKLKSKADTLFELRPRLTQGKVAPLFISSVKDWEKNSGLIIDQIQAELGSKTVVVRSSAKAEDTSSESLAGAFKSVLSVDCNDKSALTRAISQVINSYASRKNQKDQFFVQEQVEDILLSGVAFTRDIDTCSPYYVINYDDSTGSTESVTSGLGKELKTYLRFRNSPKKIADARLENLFTTIKELENLYHRDDLDIEFAVNKAGIVYILQVRPIAFRDKKPLVSDELLEKFLFKIHKKAEKFNKPHPGLYGKRGLYSVMTDWNPAEMIGIRPRKLGLSLYKDLITDTTWAYQREKYGYKRLRGFPLLVSFLDLPYIDVRVSLSSFVPDALDEDLSHKLVDYYTNQLLAHPSDHDKVEFNIIYSCYDLNIHQKLQKLSNHGFSTLEIDRIKFALLNLTNEVIKEHKGLCQQDLDRISTLDSRYHEIISSDMSTVDKIYWLLEDCRRYGTLPFAGLARAGFIAVQMLRSMVEVEIISDEEYHTFLNSLDTVARQLSTDYAAYQRGKLPKTELKQKYGHLRPGTYDILSPRYDEAFEAYFSGKKISEPPHAKFDLSDEKQQQIKVKLSEHGIEANAESLFNFFRSAIEGREYGKFMFTRNLSDALVLLEELGVRVGVSREELSYLDIKIVRDLYASLSHEDLDVIFQRDISANKASHQMAQAIRLPALIAHEDHIYDFFLDGVEPNYITRNKITEVIVLEDDLHNLDLSNKIVFIKGADPGYDWIFSRDIGGLITMYGGANSHMAIRCAELNIPAVIGCGEQNFKIWSKSERLEIDCSNRQVKVIA